MCFSLQKGQPAGEHAVDEQRVDDEQACGVSSVSSKQKEQQKEHTHDEIKICGAQIHSSSHL